MQKIVTVYQGSDEQREFEKIKTTLNSHGINFHKNIYLGFSGHHYWSTPFYLQNGYWPQGFEIKVLRKDEFVARKLLELLGLSHQLAPEKPTIWDDREIFRLLCLLIIGVMVLFYVFFSRSFQH